ncbi:hypothetical protein C0J52_01578 [Blattella germanica]|nr:hypothetical protein C0J52_01578 [Blattella germanica]
MTQESNFHFFQISRPKLQDDPKIQFSFFHFSRPKLKDYIGLYSTRHNNRLYTR